MKDRVGYALFSGKQSTTNQATQTTGSARGRTFKIDGEQILAGLGALLLLGLVLGKAFILRR